MYNDRLIVRYCFNHSPLIRLVGGKKEKKTFATYLQKDVLRDSERQSTFGNTDGLLRISSSQVNKILTEKDEHRFFPKMKDEPEGTRYKTTELCTTRTQNHKNLYKHVKRSQQ
jgi:hypothetical protein